MKFELFNEHDERKITLPRRATDGSCGYDFYAPEHIFLLPGMEQVIHTGIKVSLEPGWGGMIVPRSGLGFKYGMRLMNTIGIIDTDFIDKEICVKIVNPSTEKLEFDVGERYCQFIFFQYGLTEDDNPVKNVREGGFGSTGK